MRSQEQSDRIEVLQRAKKQLKQDLSDIDKELSKLTLEHKESIKTESPSKPLPPTELFPIGSIVRITNKRDPGGLYLKTGKVTGHTKRQVRVTIDNKEYRRAPTSLKQE